MGDFEITWHGHSCFSVVDKGTGYTIVFDPFKPETGKLPSLDVKGDLVLASHGHFDHGNVEAVAKWTAEKLVGFVGERSIGEVRVRGVETYHDEAGGSKRGANSVYVVKFKDGVFCHLGDLGHVLEEEQVSKINGFGRIDVLFIPVGGIYTIDPDEAVKVIKQLNPRVAIPMHYYDDRLNKQVFRNLAPVDKFLEHWDGPVRKHDSAKLEVTTKLLPELSTVFVLKPPE